MVTCFLYLGPVLNFKKRRRKRNGKTTCNCMLLSHGFVSLPLSSLEMFDSGFPATEVEWYHDTIKVNSIGNWHN